jgi:hypothetical protein
MADFIKWWQNLGSAAQIAFITPLVTGIFSVFVALIQHRPRIAAGIACAILLFVAGVWFWPKLSPTHESLEKSSDVPKSPSLISKPFTSEPFYVERIEPILDKGLFVARDYAYFIIGGRNLNLIAIDVRSAQGQEVELKYDEDFRYGKCFKVRFESEPYFEIQYRGNFYSIEVRLGRASSPYYTIAPITATTLQPKPVNIHTGQTK